MENVAEDIKSAAAKQARSSPITGTEIFSSPALRTLPPLSGLPIMENVSALIAATTVLFGAAMGFLYVDYGKWFGTGDSSMWITASEDQSAKIWDVMTGTPLFTFNFRSAARFVDLSVGDKLVVITTDPFMEVPAEIHVKAIATNPADQSKESLLTLKGPTPQSRINRAVWGPLNKTIISAGEDAVIRIWDSETGKLLQKSNEDDSHKKGITSLSKSVDGSHFITGSLDKSAKLWDSRT